jgi:hypothetical protein
MKIAWFSIEMAPEAVRHQKMDYVSIFNYMISSKPIFFSIMLVLAAKKAKVAKFKCCSPPYS